MKRIFLVVLFLAACGEPPAPDDVFMHPDVQPHFVGCYNRFLQPLLPGPQSPVNPPANLTPECLPTRDQ